MLNESQLATLKHLNGIFGATVTRAELMAHYAKSQNNGILPRWLMSDTFKVDRGVFSTVADETTKLDPKKPFPKFKSKIVPAAISSVVEPTTESASAAEATNVVPMVRPAAKIQLGTHGVDTLVPARHPAFVAFGKYDDVYTVIKAGIFYPVFITGLSGNGKTLMVEEACAKLKRECVRVQITPETDEDDLIGGFRLINGETVWFDGPVVVAAMRGAICLIDEIDYGTGKISCLQGILEGKGIFLKKVNRTVVPKEGFNIIATANTKGRGSEENGGRFINTNIMNEAFLERFAVCLEQEYPPMKTEVKILEKELALREKADDEFVKALTTWAEVIRRSFEAGAMEDIITTRRLVHIVKTYCIFGDKKDAIAKCVARFDKQTRDTFIQLFDKVCVDSGDVTAPDADVKVDDDGEVSMPI